VKIASNANIPNSFLIATPSSELAREDILLPAHAFGWTP